MIPTQRLFQKFDTKCSNLLFSATLWLGRSDLLGTDRLVTVSSPQIRGISRGTYLTCLWPSDKCKSNIHTTLSSVFGLYQAPRKIFWYFWAQCPTIRNLLLPLCLYVLVVGRKFTDDSFSENSFLMCLKIIRPLPGCEIKMSWKMLECFSDLRETVKPGISKYIIIYSCAIWNIASITRLNKWNQFNTSLSLSEKIVNCEGYKVLMELIMWKPWKVFSATFPQGNSISSFVWE